MMPVLIKRLKLVDGQERREPTSLAIALVLAGSLVAIALCLAWMMFWPALGQSWWLLATVVALLAWLLAIRRFRLFHLLPGASWRQSLLSHVLGAGWKLTMALVACWLGLSAWSELSAGGPAAAPKGDAQWIRVVTWNIHCGQDAGLPWQRFDWPARKHALHQAVEQAAPDILCVQEAMGGQVCFLEQALPEHRRVGVGRDDGSSGGEHCAIYFDARRFDELASGTFWLEEPTDQPRGGSAFNFKRLCTWVRLLDRDSGRVLRIYNTHLYLTEAARRAAVKPILAHIAAGDPEDAVLLTADFNAPPSAPSRRSFGDAKLTDSAVLAGQPLGTRSFHLYGIPLRCLDGVLVDGHWAVRQHTILRSKPGNLYPSDHFGVLADLDLHAGRFREIDE